MVFIDRPGLRLILDRDGEEMGGSVDENIIAVDISSLDVHHIVIKHPAINRKGKLIITQVGKEIGLHDGHSHACLFTEVWGILLPGEQCQH